MIENLIYESQIKIISDYVRDLESVEDKAFMLGYLAALGDVSYINTYIDKITEDRKLLIAYNNKEKTLKILLKELSPSEGIIAKSINSFLNVFIAIFA